MTQKAWQQNKWRTHKLGEDENFNTSALEVVIRDAGVEVVNRNRIRVQWGMDGR